MQTQKLLKYIVIIGLFLAPFSVLFIANSLFFPFITGKVFFYRILIEIVGAAWIMLALSDASYRPRKHTLLYLLIALLTLLFISNIMSVYPYKAFWSNFERMDGWITLVHHVLFFVVLSSVFVSEKIWKNFWNVSLAVSVIVCFYGFLQYTGAIPVVQGGSRIDGTFGNAAYLAVYTLFHVFIAVWLLYKSRIRGIRVLYGGVALLNLFCLYATATRGAMLGFGAGIIVTALIMLVRGKEHPRLRYASGGLLVLIIVSSIALFAAKDTRFVQSHTPLARIAHISLTEGATRFKVWNMAVQGVKEKPILGWGQEGFSTVFAAHYTPDMYGQEPWFDRVHNIILDWAIMGGIIGLGLYLSVLFFGLRYLWRSTELDIVEKALFSGLYIGYIVQNIFVFDNVGSYILFFSVLAFLTTHAHGYGEAKVVGGEKQVSEGTGIMVRAGVGVALVCALYLVNIKPISAGKDLIHALTPNQSGEAIVGFYTDAFDKHTFATPEIVEQMMTQTSAFLENPTYSNEIKQEYVNTLIPQLEHEVEKRPHEARLLYAAGVFYNRINQQEKAIAVLEHARDISPQKQIILFELAFAYIAHGEQEKGIELLEYTYNLAPEFVEAHKMYALGAVYIGDQALAEKLFAELPEDFIYTDDRVIQVYATTKQLPKLLDIWQWRVEHQPDNIQNRVSLAATYLELGRKAEAIQTLRDAIDAEPQFKDQGEQFIESIQKGEL